MAEDIHKIIKNIFDNENFTKFSFNETTGTIVLDRTDNSADTIIFNELNTLTQALVSSDVDFAIDNDGTILIQ